MARAWGVGIAPNRLIDHARRNKKMAFVALQDSPSGRDMETMTLDRMAMREALASLKVDERDLLAMRGGGVSHGGIARVQSPSADAVKKSGQRTLLRRRPRLRARRATTG